MTLTPNSFSVWKSASSVFMLVLAIIPELVFSQPNRVNHNGRNLFINGGNIAWINFGGDVGPGNTDLAQFETMFREVRDNGGNSMRIWLHPTGNNLAWSGTTVTGPGTGFVKDLEDILNLAKKYDVSLLLTLWSFDMLRISNGTTTTDRNYAVLTDSTKMASYIQNALVPMVTALKDHPAIWAWEICNEPEGMTNEFGWDGNRKVPMLAIQRLVNRMTGAIHRVDPKLRVTNGAWSFKSTQDAIKANTATDMNYYRNDRLIAAGGDADGKLDFYTVHYYDWAGTNLSPFHHHADRWNLDKPIVVAEFYMKGAIFSVAVDSLYKKLYQNGYAGAMAWQWVDYVQNRDNNTASWPNALKNMRFMRDNYLQDVSLTYNGMRMESFSALRSEIEPGQSTDLSWTVRGAVSVTLNGEKAPPVGVKKINPSVNTSYKLKATSAEGVVDSLVLDIKVIDAELINRARLAVVQANTGSASAVQDGDVSTGWTGNGAPSELVFDLRESIALSRIVIRFGTAYATGYDVSKSFDGVNWSVLASETSGNGGDDELVLTEKPEGRYVRIRFNTFDAVSSTTPRVNEVEMYGRIAAVQPPTILLTAPTAGLTFDAGTNVTLSATVTAGSQPVTYVKFLAGTDSVGADANAPYSFTWRAVAGVNVPISAVAVTANHRVQSVSRTISVVSEVQKRRLEAEAATRTGTLASVSETSASGGRFIRMDNDGTLTWSNIMFDQGGTYTVRFGYRLPFDTKTQYVLLNGVKVDSVVFDGTVNTWLTKDRTYSFIAGSNTLAIEKYWGYMQFDYVEIRGDGQFAVSTEREAEVSEDFNLMPNYPNPFNPQTTIPFSLNTANRVTLDVLDMNGRVVQTLVNGVFGAGNHHVQFDAQRLSSGVYLYRLQTQTGQKLRKMILMK